jgi:hypothetical protein
LRLCSPLSPRDAYWVDLLPDQSITQAIGGKLWRVWAISLVASLAHAGFLCTQSLQDPGWLSSLIYTIINIVFFTGNLVTGTCLFRYYAYTPDLVTSRRICYHAHVFILLIMPTVNAFAEPMQAVQLHLVVLRRCLRVCMIACVQVFMFEQVLIKVLLWSLPGLVVHLIRFCFLWSVETHASPVQSFEYARLCSLAACILAFLVHLGVRRCQRTGSTQVQSIVSTPRPVAQTIGSDSYLSSVSVVPIPSSPGHDVYSLPGAIPLAD